MTISISSQTRRLHRKRRPIVFLATLGLIAAMLPTPAQAQIGVCGSSIFNIFQCFPVALSLMVKDAAKLYDDRDLTPPTGNSRFETGQSIAGGSGAQSSPPSGHDPVELCWGGSYIPRSQCPPHP